MKIDDPIKATATLAIEGNASSKNRETGKWSCASGKSIDNIPIDLALMFSQRHFIETAITLPEGVDYAKVEKIKQVIGEDRFRVHPEVIADRLLEIAGSLLRTRHSH